MENGCQFLGGGVTHVHQYGLSRCECRAEPLRRTDPLLQQSLSQYCEACVAGATPNKTLPLVMKGYSQLGWQQWWVVQYCMPHAVTRTPRSNERTIFNSSSM